MVHQSGTGTTLTWQVPSEKESPDCIYHSDIALFSRVSALNVLFINTPSCHLCYCMPQLCYTAAHYMRHCFTPSSVHTEGLRSSHPEKTYHIPATSSEISEN